ncbi:MAG: hypothetical protein DWQ36_25140 [Acidobacteria bacterium]|nr:MAG: hypothetical protein DWQ36_25140 [Acidobacteriota bacterium]
MTRRRSPDPPRFGVESTSLRRRAVRWAWFLAAAALPGALAGAQIAGLLFFLNPHWRTDLGPWLRTVLLYSTLLALAGLLLQLPFFWARPRRLARALPWMLVMVFVGCGALHWWHASHLGHYLPPGINRRLIKAGFLLLSSGLAGFYIALLHSMQRRAYRLRSRVALCVLCLLSVYVVVERREAYRPGAAPTPRPARVAPDVDAPRILVVGISALTLDAVLPLAEQGRLPFLAQVVRNGSVVRLTSLEPSRHEPLWWTAMTGVLPYRLADTGAQRHAADFIEPGEVFREVPSGIGFRHWGVPGGSLPMRRSEPAYPPLWDVAERIGVESVQLGFQPEPTTASAAAGGGAPSPTSPDSARRAPAPPGSASAAAGDAAVCAGARDFLDQMRAEQVAQSWLDAARRDLELAERALPVWRPAAVAGAPHPRAVFLRLDGLRGISRNSFGAFVRVELEASRSEALYGHAADVERYYIFLDRLLGDLWSAAADPVQSPGRTLAIVSAYGVRDTPSSVLDWTGLWPSRAHEGSFRGAPDGTLLLAGHGVRAGTSQGEITDVSPTLAYLLGMPVARDLDGTVLAEVFVPQFLAERPLRFVPSYGTVARPVGARTNVGLLPERPTSPADLP